MGTEKSKSRGERTQIVLVAKAVIQADDIGMRALGHDFSLHDGIFRLVLFHQQLFLDLFYGVFFTVRFFRAK